jgi:hypothetical protein
MSNTQDGSGGSEQLWWGRPHDARRYHVFEGEMALARSLCSKWMMSHSADMPEVSPDEDTFVDGDDCKVCSRKAGVLQD